jgi:hypothetical protein
MQADPNMYRPKSVALSAAVIKEELSNTAIKKGYLNKASVSSGSKGWRRRYFVLTQASLIYHTDEK